MENKNELIKWWYPTLRKLEIHARNIERSFTIRVEVVKTGWTSYDFHLYDASGEHRGSVFAYSNDEAMGVIRGLKSGISLTNDWDVSQRS